MSSPPCTPSFIKHTQCSVNMDSGDRVWSDNTALFPVILFKHVS